MLRSWLKIKWMIKSWGRPLLNSSRKAGPAKENCGALGLFPLRYIYSTTLLLQSLITRKRKSQTPRTLVGRKVMSQLHT